MDDPWGSPWADELQHDAPLPIPIPQSSAIIGVGDAGEKEKVKADSVGGGHDAWGTGEVNDGFGEWASLPGEDGNAAMGFDGASDAWETRHKGDEGELANGRFGGHAMPWGESATIQQDVLPISPPTLLPVPAEPPRQPSPDPWSMETIAIGGEDKDAEYVGRGEDQAVESDNTVIAEAQEGYIPSQVTSPEQEPLRETNGTIHEELPGSEIPVESTHVTNLINPVTPEVFLDGAHEKEIEVDQVSSRPSSSPSDHDEILPESPRTSLDEDTKRPAMVRNVSSKVQELVEHFDGLAKPMIEEAEPTNAVDADDRTPDLHEEEAGANEHEEGQEEDFDDDFGDFEEGHSDADDVLEEQPEVGSEVPLAEPGQDCTVLEPPEKPASAPTEDSSTLVSSPPRRILKDFGRVKYSPEPSLFGQLYPGEAEEAPEKVFIPDVIPADSFSTVEQRKTWYRVSRYGTMQKHNAGDDENYVRINWPQSQMRGDTLKIVARWMEEDRMSGRVVLGGGSKGSSRFGWNDPNAPPVSLASAFAAKSRKKRDQAAAPIQAEPEVPREWPKGLVRSRSSSKTRSSSKPRKSTASRSNSKSEDMKVEPQRLGSLDLNSVGQPQSQPRRMSSRSKNNSVELKIAPEPVANFGWNTASQDLQSQIPIPLAPQIEPLAGKSMLNPRQSAAKAPALSPIFSPTFQGNQSVTSDFNGLASLMQPESASTPAAAPALNSVFDQDDDWGEMVSSPITTNPPAFPPSNGLRHKKSQSLVGSNHDLVMPAVAKNPHFPSPLSRPGHKPTSSLDRLTVSKTRTSAILNTEPSSLDIFDEISTTPPVSHATEPQPTLQTTAIPVTNGNADPWASADFSFFDTPTPTTKPAPPRTARPIPRSIPPKSTPPKSVAFATKPIPPPAQRGNGKSKSEIEQDRIVAGIVKGLPDLSYMLRK